MAAVFSKTLNNSEEYLADLGRGPHSTEKNAFEIAAMLTARSGLMWDAHIGEEGKRDGHLYVYPAEGCADDLGRMPPEYWDVLVKWFGATPPLNGGRWWVILSDEIPVAMRILQGKRR